MTRTFDDKPATRERVPLLIGLVGPSGGGKTYSALRLATGIQKVSGGDVFYIDTEARRALHYADKFQFRHVPFGAPFSPLDYLEAIEHCVAKGAKTIVVDSMSHEHEGPGGVLEWHARDHEAKGGGENTKMIAWAKPKAARRRLINSILQLPVNFIFCFRAKEKVKVATKQQRAAGQDSVQQLGFMPIAGDEFVYEMTTNCLLMPNAGGVPTWRTDEIGERLMIKLPDQFRGIFATEEPLNETHGEKMAQWAAGGIVNVYGEIVAVIRAAPNMVGLETAIQLIEKAKTEKTVTPNEYRAVLAAYKSRKEELNKPAENYDSQPDATGTDGDQ